MKRLIISVGFLLVSPAMAQDRPREMLDLSDRYTYLAHVVRVVDGDTIDVDIDLGFNTWRRDERLRLARINAPEVRGPERAAGFAAKAALRQRIEGKWLIMRTLPDRRGHQRKGSFGRYLAEIYDRGQNINDWLMDQGLAKL